MNKALGKNQSWVKKISDSEKYREGMLKKEPINKEGSEIEPETISLKKRKDKII